MKSNVENLPIAHEALGEMIRGQDWGGMTSAYMQYSTGLDLIEFRPHDQMSEVLTHVVGKL